jgi:hypothetical protein
MNVVQFFEYLAEHGASRELGLTLAAVYARATVQTGPVRSDACLAGASPNAA